LEYANAHGYSVSISTLGSGVFMYCIVDDNNKYVSGTPRYAADGHVIIK
jgi:hypothetical protein